MDFLLRKFPLAFFVLFSLCIHSLAEPSFFDLPGDDNQNELIFPTEQADFEKDAALGPKSFHVEKHFRKEKITTTPPPVYCPPCPTCPPYTPPPYYPPPTPTPPYYPPPTPTPPHYPPYQTPPHGQPAPPPPHYREPPRQQQQHGPPPPRQPSQGNFPREAEGEPDVLKNSTPTRSLQSEYSDDDLLGAFQRNVVAGKIAASPSHASASNISYFNRTAGHPAAVYKLGAIPRVFRALPENVTGSNPTNTEAEGSPSVGELADFRNWVFRRSAPESNDTKDEALQTDEADESKDVNFRSLANNETKNQSTINNFINTTSSVNTTANGTESESERKISPKFSIWRKLF